MVCASPEEKERVLSQVKRVIRPLYSSPPMQYAKEVILLIAVLMQGRPQRSPNCRDYSWHT